MPQRRAAGFHILPIAWRFWEEASVPHRLEAVVAALFAMADSEVTLARLSPLLPVWKLTARHAGIDFALVGARDPSGAWLHIVAVTAR